MKSWLKSGLLVLALLLVLAGCGGAQETSGGQSSASENEQNANTTESETAPEQTTNETEDEAEEAETGTTEEGPIVLQDALGEVKLDKPAKRVVALEWTYAEDVLAVGVQPVGVADIENYKKWVNIEPKLDDQVADVGTRQEPSLESIAALEPDLIITATWRHEAIKEQLDAIAPTLMFNAYPGEDGPDQYEEMETTFRTIAKAVGKSEEAEAVLQKVHETYEQATRTLREAGMTDSEFALVQAFSSGEAATLRIFTDNAMATQILEKIGLRNAWESEKFEMYGFTQTTVEALPAVGDANFLYAVQDDDNVFENQLADNPVWTSLPFVQENRTYPLGGDTWLFGGPLSAELIAKTAVTALTE